VANCKKSLLEKADDADPEQTKQLRLLEGKLAKERHLRMSAESKYRQVENELAEALLRQELWNSIERELAPQPLVVKKLKSSAPATPILLCSDWHVEQKVTPAKINGLNAYNLDIARKRAQELFPRWLYLVEASRSISKMKTAVVWLGGDFISGAIHPELMESNYLSPTDAILFAEDLIVDGLDHLLKHGGFDHIDVVCNDGNHGRTTEKKRVATRTENSFEMLMYKHLRKMFRLTPKVKFHIAAGEQIIFQVQRSTIRFQHGDAVKFGGGVGGLTIPMAKAIAQWNKGTRVDFDVMGHWHQFLPNYWFLVNPPMIGYDEFALHIKAECQPPAQGLLIVDRDRGVVDQRRVFVEKPKS
jgi:hypothetical protein